MGGRLLDMLAAVPPATKERAWGSSAAACGTCAPGFEKRSAAWRNRQRIRMRAWLWGYRTAQDSGPSPRHVQCVPLHDGLDEHCADEGAEMFNQPSWEEFTGYTGSESLMTLDEHDVVPMSAFSAPWDGVSADLTESCSPAVRVMNLDAEEFVPGYAAPSVFPVSAFGGKWEIMPGTERGYGCQPIRIEKEDLLRRRIRWYLLETESTTGVPDPPVEPISSDMQVLELAVPLEVLHVYMAIARQPLPDDAPGILVARARDDLAIAWAHGLPSTRVVQLDGAQELLFAIGGLEPTLRIRIVQDLLDRLALLHCVATHWLSDAYHHLAETFLH